MAAYKPISGAWVKKTTVMSAKITPELFFALDQEARKKGIPRNVLVNLILSDRYLADKIYITKDS